MWPLHAPTLQPHAAPRLARPKHFARQWKAGAAMLISFAFCPLTYGQDTHPTNPIRVDLAIPDSPVSALLGASTSAVIPSSGRALGLGLIRSLDGTGKLKDGIHFEFSPASLFSSPKSGDTHREPSALDSLKIGFATAAGSGLSAEGQRIATGLHVNLIDKGAPAADVKLSACNVYMLALHATDAEKQSLVRHLVENKLSPSRGAESLLPQNVFGLTADSNLPSLAQFEKTMSMDLENSGQQKASNEILLLNLQRGADARMPSFANSIHAQACRARSEARNWNRTRLMVGAATSWYALDATKSSFKPGKQGLWTTYVYGFEEYASAGESGEEQSLLRRYAQVVLHGQVLRKDIVADSTLAGGNFSRNKVVAGLGIRFGRADLNAIIGGRAERVSSAAKGNTATRTLSLQAETRVAKDVWLNFSVDGKGTSSTGDNKPFAFAGIKWGSSSAATLAP